MTDYNLKRDQDWARYQRRLKQIKAGRTWEYGPLYWAAWIGVLVVLGLLWCEWAGVLP